jgi:hypothetical protein
METVPLLACLPAMLVLAWLAHLEDILGSLTFSLAYCLLLMCVYSRVSSIMNGKATEEQMLNSCRAKAAEEVEPLLEELKELRANKPSLVNTITTLRRDLTASRHR